jgi:hypothetical protein
MAVRLPRRGGMSTDSVEMQANVLSTRTFKGESTFESDKVGQPYSGGAKAEHLAIIASWHPGDRALPR